MKRNLKKSASILLALILLLPSFAIFGVKAAVNTLDRQKVLPVMEVTLPVVQDGEILGDEYGTEEPTVRLHPGKDYWAEDMEGNPVTENLPSYIDLYLARREDRLFVGIVAQEERHTVNEYLLDAFLGFGDDTNSHTMNSGNTTSYRMKKMTRANYLREWMDTRPYAHTAKIVAEDGTVTESTPLYDKLYEYPLVEWGEIGEDENGLPVTVFEIEMGFEDAVVGSGKEWNETPDFGYFSFDLALFNSTERCGTLHFTKKLGGEGEAQSVPHVLDLKGETPINVKERNAFLSSLELENATLTPAFDPDWYEYSAGLSFDLPAVVNAVAMAKDNGAVVQILGAAELGTNGMGTIRVVVTAKNGYQKTYLIHLERDYIYADFSASNQSEFDQVLKQIGETEYTAKDAVRIHLDGEIASENGVLFGFETLWNTAGNKVPVFLCGGTVILPEGSVASANDITFQNVLMPIGDKNVTFYAGAGNVVFDSVDFGENGKDAKAKFFGDTHTDAVFEGWSEEQKKSVSTSVTFSGDTVYTPGDTLLGAVGADTAISSINSASFIVDGATVSYVGARVGSAEIRTARVVVKSGSVKRLSGDDGESVIGVTDTLTGNTELLVSGGQVDKILPFDRVSHTGNYSLTVEEKDPLIPTVIGEVKSASLSEICGFAELTVTGGTFKGDVAGSPSAKAVYNTVTGGTFKGDFAGSEGSARKIVNVIRNATFKGNVYGGSQASSYIRGITNTFDSITVTGSIYGGCGSGILYGNVKNTLTDCTVKEGFFGGNNAGTVNGNITNTSVGGSYTHSHDFTDVEVNADVALIPAFAGGNRDGAVRGNIKNTLTDDSIGRTFSGSGNCDVTGNVKNTLIGIVSITDCFFGGASSHAKDVTIGGQVTNLLKANEKGAPYINAKSTNHGIAYIGGSHGTNQSVGILRGGIVNIIEAGTIATRYFGSSIYGGADGIGLNEYGESVTNIIYSGKFSNVFNGGSINAETLGNIGTYISGGTFANAVTGGNRAMYGGFDHTIVLHISGGVFQSNIFGASHGLTDAQKAHKVHAVEMAISGGSFDATVYAGGKGATPMDSCNLTVTGGTFKLSIYAGSESKNAVIPTGGAVAVIEPKDGDIFIGANLYSRNEKEVITLNGGAYKLLLGTSSSLKFNSYDGVAQVVEQTGSFTADHVYLQVPADKESFISISGNVTASNGIFTGIAG